MMHKRLWLLLSLAVCVLILASVRPVQAQETIYPPLGEYILFWQPADDAPAGCQAASEGELQTPAADEECDFCGCPPEAFAPAQPGQCPAEAWPPEHLWAVLLDLQARGQVEILERLPDEPALRLLANAEAAIQLSSHPETARLLLIEPVPAFPGEKEGQAAPMPSPVEEVPEPAGPSPGTPPVETPPEVEIPAKPMPPEPAPLIMVMPAGPLDEIIDYTWVNNQGDDPPITYNWVEISGTGTIVAQGDDTYTGVDLGFSFTFYGTIYTRAYVSSNGFVSFGSPSSSASNASIPNPSSPNNAIYGFWDDLKPTGDDNGSVYVQQVDATTFVIEWYHVKRYGSSDYETFQIILNGADNTILLQYQDASYTSSCTAGVENASGTRATQYVYNTSNAIFDELAVLFTPTQVTVYTIEGTVRDYDGTPVSWAKVEVVAGPMLVYDYTDASGTYTLTVTAGSYTLRANKDGYFTTPERTVTVPPNQASIDLIFPQRYTISGTVRDYDGTLLSSIRVSTSGGPVSESDYTDANGEYSLTVISGTYTVKAEKYYSKLDPPVQTVTVPPSHTDVDFTFPERYTISGTVRDYDGTPLEYVQVATDWSDPVSVRDYTGANGDYTLTVISGTYTLRAQKSGYPNNESRHVTVPPSQMGVDFTLPERYTIGGTVYDYDGMPLEYVRVYVSEGPVSVSDSTDTSGVYMLTVISGTYTLRAEKSGYPNNELRYVTVPPSQTGVDFTFSERFTISGTVYDCNGTPLQSVWVRTYSGPVSDYDYTDVNGEYSLTGISGTYNVEAEKYYSKLDPPAQTVTVPPSQTGVDFTFPERYTISGTVYDYDGMPLQSVWVRIYSGPVSASDHTDADGLYALTVISGTYQIEASKSGYPGPPRQAVTVPPSQTEVDLTFPERYTISGTVYDYDGTPMQGVQIHTYSGPVSDYAYTDAHGLYALTVISGTYRIEANRSGYASPPRQTVTVPPSRTDVNFTFAQQYAVTGTVRDYDGTPLSGIEVSSDPFDVGVRTDSNGQYLLHLPAGLYCLSVDSWDLPEPPSQAVLVPPEQEGVDFTFPERFIVSGTVRDYDGTSMQGVWVRTASGPVYDSDYTDSDGTYSLIVIAGTYRIEAEEYGRVAPDDRIVTVPPDQAGVGFTFPQAYTIAGTTRHAEGQPVSDAYVGACPGTGGSCVSDWTDADGRYVLRLVAGSWRVYASKSGLSSPPDQMVTVPPDREGVDFVFHPAVPVQQYTIAGMVRDPDGNPLVGIRVKAGTGSCGGEVYADTLATGRYTITVSTADTYLVEAGTERRLVTVPPDATGVDFTHPGLYTIAGTVQDADSQPVANVSVQTTVAGQDVYDYTDTNGHYALRVPPGTYQVSVSRTGYVAPPPSTVTVPPGQTAVDFAFPVGYRILGVVRDSSGRAVSYAQVQATGPSGSATVISTWSCGAYELVVPAGTYTVTVQHWNYVSPPVQTATVPPDRLLLNFTLGDLSVIAGVVSDYDGSPVEGVYVRADGREDYDHDYTDASGAYQLRAQPGTYQVKVFKSGYPTAPEQTVSVPPDRTNVNFTFPARYTVQGNVRDNSGQPLLNAEVTAENLVCGLAGGNTRTDAAGTYTLTLGAGSYEVRARAEGYDAPLVRQVTVPPTTGNVDFIVILPVRYAVSGVVWDSSSGSPLADARVYTYPCGRPGDSTDTATDGSYTLMLTAGTYVIWSCASDHLCAERSLTVTADTTGVDFSLTAIPPAPRYTIYGYVTDDQGWALDGVYVRTSDGPDYDSDWTGSCGRYRLILDRPGTYTIQASKAGYTTPPTLIVTLPPNRADVDFVLTPISVVRYTVSGIVRDQDRQPVFGADVDVCLSGGGVCEDDTTDGQGRYAVIVPQGTYSVSTDKACYVDAPSQWVTVPPDATVDVTLRRITNRISGQVTDSSGAAVYNSWVNGSSPGGSVSASTNTNGDYTLRVSADTWSISAPVPWNCPYVQPPSRLVAVPPDQTGVNFVMHVGTPEPTATPTSTRTPGPTSTRTPTPTGTPTPTRTPTPTCTPTPTATSTPTPTATPTSPWINWDDPGLPLLLPPRSTAADVLYGNIPVPATLTATLTGPATFADGSQELAVDITNPDGIYTLHLKQAVGAMLGDTFTLEVILGELRLERMGTIAQELYLPLMCRKAP